MENPFKNIFGKQEAADPETPEMGVPQEQPEVIPTEKKPEIGAVDNALEEMYSEDEIERKRQEKINEIERGRLN